MLLVSSPDICSLYCAKQRRHFMLRPFASCSRAPARLGNHLWPCCLAVDRIRVSFDPHDRSHDPTLSIEISSCIALPVFYTDLVGLH